MNLNLGQKTADLACAPLKRRPVPRKTPSLQALGVLKVRELSAAPLGMCTTSTLRAHVYTRPPAAALLWLFPSLHQAHARLPPPPTLELGLVRGGDFRAGLDEPNPCLRSLPLGPELNRAQSCVDASASYPC